MSQFYTTRLICGLDELEPGTMSMPLKTIFIASPLSDNGMSRASRVTQALRAILQWSYVHKTG